MSEEITTVTIDTINIHETFDVRHLSKAAREALRAVAEMIRKETIE